MSVTIQRISSDLTTTTKIEQLNDMIMQLNGLVSKGRFDKNEIDSLYTTLLASNRKFNRDVSLGNTLTNYNNWSHVIAESGYSIWKIAISDYTYNALNALYLDDKLLENKGEASSESASSFNKVFSYDGETYTNNTTEAASVGGTEFEMPTETENDYIYLGGNSTFGGAKFEFATRGSNYTLKVEYYNGSSGDGWEELTVNDDNLVDNTNDFESDGNITFDIPDDWELATINSEMKYWIRITSSTTPVTTAEAYYIVPANSVVGLLALSNSNVLNENWAWCSYGTSVYVTIPNDGAAAYEGDAYITSSSSATNKQNYFIYNHEYSIDYEDSDYTSSSYDLTEVQGIATSAESGESITAGDCVYISDDDTISLAEADETSTLAHAVVDSISGSTYYIRNTGSVTLNTVGDGDITAGDKLYLADAESGSSGKVASSAGSESQVIGIALSAEESGDTVQALLNIHN